MKQRITPLSLKNLGFEEENWTYENIEFSEFVLRVHFACITHTYKYMDGELIEENTQIELNDWVNVKDCDIHKIKRLITKIKAVRDELNNI